MNNIVSPSSTTTWHPRPWANIHYSDNLTAQQQADCSAADSFPSNQILISFAQKISSWLRLSTTDGQEITAFPVLKDHNIWSIYCQWTFIHGKSRDEVHPVHTMQTKSAGGGVAQLILNHRTGHKWVLSPTPWMLTTTPPAQTKPPARCIAPEQSQCCGLPLLQFYSSYPLTYTTRQTKKPIQTPQYADICCTWLGIEPSCPDCRVITGHKMTLLVLCIKNIYKTKTKLRGLSPRANYTDRAAGAGRRS